jgi:hypothetical protein
VGKLSEFEGKYWQREKRIGIGKGALSSISSVKLKEKHAEPFAC